MTTPDQDQPATPASPPLDTTTQNLLPPESQTPTSLSELADRKMMYQSMMQYWQSRRRMAQQMARINLADPKTLAVATSDHMMVQALKMLAADVHLQSDDKARSRALAAMVSAVVRCDDAMAETNRQQTSIAMELTRIKARKPRAGVDGDDGDGTIDVDDPRSIAGVLRASGMSEADIERHMGPSYPGPVSKEE